MTERAGARVGAAADGFFLPLIEKNRDPTDS